MNGPIAGVPARRRVRGARAHLAVAPDRRRPLRAGARMPCRCRVEELTKVCAEADDASHCGRLVEAVQLPRLPSLAVRDKLDLRVSLYPSGNDDVHRCRGAHRRPLVQPLGLHQRDQRRRALRDRRRRRHVHAAAAHDRPQDRAARRSEALARPGAPRDRGLLRAPVHERARAVARQPRQRAQGARRGGRRRPGPMRRRRGRMRETIDDRIHAPRARRADRASRAALADADWVRARRAQ